MQGVFKVGVCVSAIALALVMALAHAWKPKRRESLTRAGDHGGAVIDAPAGFDVVSNGFAEEFCASWTR